MAESPDATVNVDAVDNASAQIAAMGNKIVATLNDFEQSARKAATTMKQTADSVTQGTQRMRDGTESAAASIRTFATSLTTIAMSALSLYRMIDSVGDAQLRLDRANLAVAKSQEKVTRLQQEYNDALKGTGIDLEKVAAAQHDVDAANHNIAESLEDLNAAQAEYDELVRSGGVDADEVAECQNRLADANTEVTLTLDEVAAAQRTYNELVKTGGIDIERVASLQLRLENANERVSDTQKATNDAQEEYNALLATGGVNLEKVADLQLSLERATLLQAQSLQSVQQAQQAFNDAQMKQLGHLDPNIKRSQMAGEMAEAYDNLQLAQQAYGIATGETVQVQNKLNSELTDEPQKNLETAEEKLSDALLTQKNAAKEASDTQAELNYQMTTAPAEALKKAQEDLTTAQQNYQTATGDAAKAQTDLNTAMAGAGAEEYTAALEKVSDVQWTYDEAVYAAGQSQKDLNKALTEIDPDGAAQSALIALQFAQEELAIKTDYAREANENLTESYATATIVGTSSIINIITQLGYLTAALTGVKTASTSLGMLGTATGTTGASSLQNTMTAYTTGVALAPLAPAVGSLVNDILTGGPASSSVVAAFGGTDFKSNIIRVCNAGMPSGGKTFSDMLVSGLQSNIFSIAQLDDAINVLVSQQYIKPSDASVIRTNVLNKMGLGPASKASTLPSNAGKPPQGAGRQGGGWVGLGGPEIVRVGEAGPEYVVPNSALGGMGGSIVNYYDIKIYVQGGGNVEARIAKALESVIIKSSSSGAPAEQKRIELANTLSLRRTSVDRTRGWHMTNY